MSTTPSPAELGGTLPEKPSVNTMDEDVQKFIPKYWVSGAWKHEVENVEMYKPGGLCPIEVVVASHSSEDRGELFAKRLLGENGIGLEEAAAHHILLPEDSFYIVGPNGRHLVLVLPLLGPPLPQWLEWNGHRDDVKKKLCRQMIKAIDFLQSQGLCHGDFRPRNMLMKLRNIDHFTEEEIREALDGAPKINRIETVAGEDPGPHAPKYAIAPGRWSVLEDEHHLILEDLVITDLGEAFVPGSHQDSRCATPRSYAAPETIFTSKPGLPSDIWSLGVSIMAVLGTVPFYAKVKDTVMTLEKYLGPLPLKYRLDFEKQHNQQLLGQYNYKRSRWQDYILMEMVSPEDTPVLEEFSLTEEQKNDPSCPAAYKSVAALEAARNQALQYGDYSYPISAALGRGKEMFFEETDPRYNPERNGLYKMPGGEADLLTDLALKIFRYEPSERTTAAEIMEHECLRGQERLDVQT
ncbi:hypothetical protein PG996_010438 [Apiospora saccharicola]|uniref:EKC/KEOPS complex subunit BUD32 n=1 Tax=Apiospora saccharicola TaxID=335842 RepID=A0ABR1UNK1_9PEZI